MCVSFYPANRDRRAVLGHLARLGLGAAALTTLGPVVWGQTVGGLPLPSEVAGVKLPKSALVEKAARQLAAEAPPVIYFHSVRTFVLGALHAERFMPRQTFNHELVLLSSLFHDIGFTTAREVANRPFEDVSGELGRDFVMKEGGYSAADADLVYRGIALHVGQAWVDMEPEVRLIAIGTRLDLYSKFRGSDFPSQEEIDRIAAALPRHRFKTAFIEEQRAHVARTGDPGPIAEFSANPPPGIAASRWRE